MNHDTESLITPIKPEVLEKMLNEAGYDRVKTQFLVDGFRNGFSLEYQGKRSNLRMTSPNLKFTIGDKVSLWNKVMQEVKLGRYAGPFDQVPFDNYIQSPIGLVPKDGGTKTRLIFHLSYPRRTGRSVNDNTPKHLTTVKYSDFDIAIRRCLEEGPGCYLAKSDFIAAFRNLCIRKKDWCLLVMKAENPRTG